ncbi:MAG: opacity protein-like surface antigen [Myxococcota bacterium]|jgi:opacity protein-like surface antigen
MLRRLVPAVLVCLLLPVGGLSHAGNQHSYALGNDAALTGGAVGATTSDGAALWYNPAGLGANMRDSVDLSGSAFVLRFLDIPDVVQTTLPSGVITRGLSGSDLLAVPSAIAYVRHLAPGLSLAFGLFVPELDKLDLSSSLAQKEATFDYRQRIRIVGDLTRYKGGLGIGWAVTPTLRLGATLFTSVGIESAVTSFWFDVESTEPDNPGRALSLFQEDATAFRVGLQVVTGVQWEPVKNWSLGFTMRTPSFDVHESHNIAELSVAGAVTPDGQGDIALGFAESGTTGFTFLQTEPFTFNVAVAWAFAEEAHIAAEVELQPGFGAGTGEDDRASLWNARVGVRFPIADRLYGGLGIFTDKSPSPDPRQVGGLQTDFLGFSAGIQIRTPLTVGKGQGPGSLVFTTTVAARYLYGTGHAGSLAIDLFGDVATPSRDPIAVTVHEIGLHLGSGLLF